MARVTIQTVETRCANLNARLEKRGSTVRYEIQRRNGHVAVDRVKASTGSTLDTLAVGRSGEIAEYLWLMMNALDDAERS
jgi:hypothetical protein